jgi:hypothetical protein
MKRRLNPELSVGDIIELYYMEGEISVPLGTQGVVTKIQPDPFENTGEIISVNWDTGSSLSLLSTTDKWVKVSKEVNESVEAQMDFFSSNEEIFDSFDWKFLRSYLKMVQSSGIVNMLAASPLLYSGSEHIERYYGEDREDDEDFQKVIEFADEAKDKMIQGTIKFMQNKGMEIELENVNRMIRKLSNKILELYILFY